MANDKEATLLKNIITGILISNPKVSTIRDLCKDFMDLEGRSIPIQQFGFGTIEEYLQSIPDAVYVNGSGPFATVKAIVSSKTEHISSMVLKQKRNKPSGFNKKSTTGRPPVRHRPSNSKPKAYYSYTPKSPPKPLLAMKVEKPFIPSNNVYPNTYIPFERNQVEEPPISLMSIPIIYDTYAKSETHQIEEPPVPFISKSVITDEVPAYVKTESPVWCDVITNLSNINGSTNLRKESPVPLISKPVIYDTNAKSETYPIEEPLVPFISKSVITDEAPDYVKTESPVWCDVITNLSNISGSTNLTQDLIDVSHDIPEDLTNAYEANLTQVEYSLQGTENLTQVSIDDSFQYTTNSRVPVRVQKKIRQLIKSFPNGLDCIDVQSEYKRLFKKRIHYDDYGFRTLIELFFDLPRIINVVQRTSDCYVLYDQEKPIPILNDEVPVKKCEYSEIVAERHILHELPVVNKTVLIPSDVLTINDKIPRFFPEDVEKDDLLDINIGEIYDLSKFWIYFTFGELDSLMTKLQSFFNTNHPRYLIPQVLLEEGLYCVANYINKYHRCVIVNMLKSQPDYIRVFFFDYGTVENVKSDSIWFLPKEFAELPCQAIRARLANIYPTYENRPWSTEAIVRFETLIQSNALVAQITRINEADHILEIYLADITDKENIFFLNDVLVREGLACYVGKERKSTWIDSTCRPNVKYIHLYPAFYEIEAGLAPTPEERQYISLNRIPLHHFMPQYFDIRYNEDPNVVLLHHDRLNKERISNITIPNVEEESFDYSLFPDIADEIRDLVEKSDKGKSKPVEKENKIISDKSESVKEYSCNRMRITRVIPEKGNTDSNSCDSSSLTADNLSSMDDTISRITGGLQDVTLLEDDKWLKSISPEPIKSTNPFMNEYNFKHTNPFWSPNPFKASFEDTEEQTDEFSKVSNDSLSQTIVNNLKDSIRNVVKETNLKNCFSSNPQNTSLGTSNVFKPLENKEVNLGQESRPRVRTPPGFSSANLQLRPAMNATPNFLPALYPFIQHNNILMHNQFAMPQVNMPPNFRNYGPHPQFFPNQYQFNVPQMFPMNFRPTYQ